MSNDRKIDKNKIKILTSKNLDTCGLMLKSLLILLNIESIIIYELDINCDTDENLYIIIYNNRKTYKMPKNYIFWQIEQTSQDESPIVKFDKKYYTDMTHALMILEFSSYNIIFYKDKIDFKNIYINPLPFYDLYHYTSECEYLYDIIFFGAKSSRRMNILNKLKNHFGNKYRLKYLFGVNGNERDNYLKKSKYVLNIHYYENALLEIERFNICLNTDCLIISENTLYEDDYNKQIYADWVTYFDDFEDLKKVIEYNLNDDVFYLKKSKLKTSKKQIQDNSLFHLHKNIITIPRIQKLINYDISYNIMSDIYCITLIENNFRYKEITFNILIATVGRPTLQNMINSLNNQLNENDCLTIVFDGHLSLPSFDLSQLKCKVNQYFEPINLGYWGHAIRNKYSNLLEKRDFIMHADDDDIYIENTFNFFRKKCINTNTLYIGCMKFNKTIIPKNNIIKEGNIGTPCGIIPYDLNLKGTWLYRFGGDGSFYEQLSVYANKIVFLEKIFYITRPSKIDIIKEVDIIKKIDQTNDDEFGQTNNDELCQTNNGEIRFKRIINKNKYILYKYLKKC